jgi:hypothetical protein
MIVKYTYPKNGDEFVKAWEILINRTIPIEECYEKMGFDFPDVER